MGIAVIKKVVIKSSFFIVILVFILMTNPSFGDQFESITKEESQIALKLLTGQTEIRLYCAPCGETEFKSVPVNKLESRDTGIENYRQIYLNGSGIDLAYAYFFQEGVWKNVALTMGLDVRDVPNPLRVIKPIDAQKLIDGCWLISEKMRAGAPPEMSNGMAKTINCLEDVIVEQAEVLFDDDQLEKLKVREKLDQMHEATGKLYWSIHNSHRGCFPYCGTMHHRSHLSDIARMFEKILRDIVKKRNDYHILPKD